MSLSTQDLMKLVFDKRTAYTPQEQEQINAFLNSMREEWKNTRELVKNNRIPY